MIRPEQIQMSADPGPNSVSARVSQVWFYGHEALVRVDLSDGAIVNARVPGHCVPASGEILHLTVEPPVHAFNSLRIMTRAPGSE
jgi:iron(III) transport system ATP-binding protein